MTPVQQDTFSGNARWDLSALYSGIDDPQIKATWDGLHARADQFAGEYRGKTANRDWTASDLASAIKEYEQILNELQKPAIFAYLLFAVEANNPEIGAFMQEQNELSTEIRVKLIFFDLELQAIPEAKMLALLGAPELASYQHFLKILRAATPHMLSEAEEKLLEETANTGSRAWIRLFDEVTANHVYKFTRPGEQETQEMTESEVLNLLRDGDRAVRQAAADSLSQGLKELSHLLVFNFNNLLQDKKTEDRLRNRPYPEHSRHMSNELEKETVDRVMTLCKENQDLVARYYRLKREILGLPELTHIDRYAPLFESKATAEWDEAKNIVLNAFEGFHPRFKTSAEKFFTNRWIDAEPRPGKGGGAFCSGMTPDTHPVVMVNYLGKLDDVMTLAHELGHGVHDVLASKQSLLNYQATLPMAELASIFAEILVFEDLVEKASTKDALALYAQKIEGIFASVFRQSAMFRFEQRAHEMRRSEGEMTADEIGDIWHDEIQSMFGDSVQLGDQHKSWWSYVGHFIWAPFYVYAYSFGELLTLSLYQQAKDGGKDFAEKYMGVLEAGSSETPYDVMKRVGVDLNSSEFWQGGFKVMESFIDRFESLWNEYKTSQA